MKNQYICGCIYTQSKKYIKVRTQRDLLFDFDWKKRVIIREFLGLLGLLKREREREDLKGQGQRGDFHVGKPERQLCFVIFLFVVQPS